jgi:hypothetical protein
MVSSIEIKIAKATCTSQRLQRQMHPNVCTTITSNSSVIQSDDVTASGHNLDETKHISSENRREPRRCRARRVVNVRPDSSGRIGNKECHIVAFAEQIEEQVQSSEQFEDQLQ